MAYVRRRSSAFSRGKSRYRGVSGHEGRWEARIGSFQGRKNVRRGVRGGVGRGGAACTAGGYPFLTWTGQGRARLLTARHGGRREGFTSPGG